MAAAASCRPFNPPDAAAIADAAQAMSSIDAFLDTCRRCKEQYMYTLDTVISNVTPCLVVSGLPSATLLEYRVEGRPVTHIINCTPIEEVPEVKQRYSVESGSLLTLGMEDDSDDLKMRDNLPKVASFVQAALKDNPSSVFLVHCKSGVNRAASVSLALLMHVNGYSLVEAFAALRAARPCVRPKYVKELALYEEQIREGPSSAPGLRDGPDSAQFVQLYYGLKNDHS